MNQPNQPAPTDGASMMGGLISFPGQEDLFGCCLLQHLEAGTTYDFRMDVAAMEYISGWPPTANWMTTNAPPINITLFGAPACMALPIPTTGCPVSNGFIELGAMAYAPDSAWTTLNLSFTPPIDIAMVMFGPPCTLPAGYQYMPYPDSTMTYFFYDDLSLGVAAQSPSISVDGALCTNDLVMTGTLGAPGGSIQWYFDGVALIGETDSVLNISQEGLTSGAYSMVVANGGMDCLVATQLVPPPAPPPVNASVTPLEGCAPLSFTHSQVSPNPNTSCLWNFGNGVLSPTCDGTSTFQHAGTYAVILQLTDSSGCRTDTVLATIEVHPSPVAGIAADTTNLSVFDTEVQLQSVSTSDVVSWWWTSGTGPNEQMSDNEDALFIFPDEGGITHAVQLIVMNEWGCLDTTWFQLTIPGSTSVYLPNAFSPNGDGINDLFGAVVRDMDPVGFSLQLFDRWGQVVFETTDPEATWHGRTKGVETPVGVYAWRMQAQQRGTTDRVVEYGHVTLIR
ncbi:MAG: gliding motility-associated C-terminal domain-containing protein [Flavobacteriales bacterium]|nr:MAG: gliding motility-associated C-terminal domain-containing protein [Flavobacteriales bacterium]